MKLLCMWRSFPVDPEFFIEAGRVHHETVILPASHGMAVVTGFQILRMRTSVHVNDSECVRTADIENVHPLQFWKVDKLHAVRRNELPRSARDLTASVRLIALERRLPGLVQRPRPWLKRHILNFDVVRQVRVGIRRIHTLRINRELNDPGRRPYSLVARRRTQIQPAVRPMRSRTRLRRSLLRVLCHDGGSRQQQDYFHKHRLPGFTQVERNHIHQCLEGPEMLWKYCNRWSQGAAALPARNTFHQDRAALLPLVRGGIISISLPEHKTCPGRCCGNARVRFEWERSEVP